MNIHIMIFRIVWHVGTNVLEELLNYPADGGSTFL
jgi:hypothetical protein